MPRETHLFDNGVARFRRSPYSRAVASDIVSATSDEEEEEDIFLALLEGLPAGGCFVNIGAAIGYYLLLAKRRRPDLVIHAFEPLAAHRRCIAENIELNGFQPSDFQIHDQGVAGQDGTADLLEKGYGSVIRKSSSPAKKEPRVGLRGLLRRWVRGAPSPPTPEVSSTAIETVTLDAACQRIGKVDLCQMDVQGLEEDVLRGARETLQAGGVRTFLIGTHRPSLHSGCRETLQANRYQILFDLYETVSQPDGILVASLDADRFALN